jgi:DNA-binding CsgD family transcriptional regulator
MRVDADPDDSLVDPGVGRIYFRCVGRFDPIRAVEACYAAADDEGEWLRLLLEAFEPLATELGLCAATYHAGPGGLRLAASAERGDPPITIDGFVQHWSRARPEVLLAWTAATPAVETTTHRFRRLAHLPGAEELVRFTQSQGVLDALNVLATDPAGRATVVSALSPRPLRVAPRVLHRLHLVTAHLAAGLRLRRLAGLGADAVLDPGGKVEHAEGAARGTEERRSLATAVLRAERARGRLRRSDPDQALGLWRGLVDGRWSLVDHVESDGRRYVLARRNPPGVRDPRALTARERDVAAYVALGHSSQYVAYALGLSSTTVTAHLRSAMRKLGVRTRRELILLLGRGDGTGG